MPKSHPIAERDALIIEDGKVDSVTMTEMRWPVFRETELRQVEILGEFKREELQTVYVRAVRVKRKGQTTGDVFNERNNS